MRAYVKRIMTRLSAFFTGGVLMREQKLFLSTVSLFFIASSMSAIFINTFIYSCAYASGEVYSGLHAVAYYNLCLYASAAFFSVITGIIGKPLASRNLMGIGLILYAVLYVLLLVWGSLSIKYVWVLGFLAGAGSTLFNLNYTGAVTYATTSENRSYYLAIQGAINSAGALLSPLFAGVFIQLIGILGGYVTLFVIVMVILVSGIICCALLSYNDGKKSATQFGNVFVFSLKDKTLRLLAIADIISGLRGGVAAFLIPLLLFSLHMSNAQVGIYLFVYVGVEILISHAVQVKATLKNTGLLTLSACLLFALSGFILFFGADVLTIFSFGTLTAVAQGIFMICAFSVFYKTAYIKIPHSHRKNLEILCVRELYLNIGRIIGAFVIMFVLAKTEYLIYTVIAFGILQIFIYPILEIGLNIETLNEAEEI